MSARGVSAGGSARGVCARGYLPGGVSVGGYLPRGVSAWEMSARYPLPL